MWILPKQLHTSPFVQDTEGLISDLQEQSQIYGQSVSVKGKLSPLRTWLAKWKKDTWTQHLSGRILQPSHGESFVEQWISSVGVFPANHLVQQEKGMPTQTNDISSHTSYKESENANQESSSWKMLRESSVQNCQETDGLTQQEHQFCCMSSESWKEWVTKARQEYSVRVKSVPPTKENECSSWPTTRSRDWKDTGDLSNVKYGKTLPVVVQENWSTPTAMEAEKSGKYAKGQMGQSLSAMAKRGELSWPTAKTSDGMGGYPLTEMTETGFRSLRARSNQWFGAKLKDAVETHEKQWPTPISGDSHLASTPEAAARRIAEGKVTLSRLVESGQAEEKQWLTPATIQIQRKDFAKREAYRKSIGRKYVPGSLEEQMQTCGHQDQDNHNTGGNRQESWPTPCPAHVRNHDEPIENYYQRVQDYQAGKTKGKPGKSLGVAARELWPTPDTTQANDGVPWEKFKKDMDARRQRVKEAGLNGSGRSPNLCAAVQNPKWATPAAYDWNVPESKEAWQKRSNEQKEKGVNLHLPLKSQVIHQSEKQPSMRLNPRWVETLMGLPVGWCLPSCTQPVTPEMMS